MDSIQSGAPSYIVEYAGVERDELLKCVAERLDGKSAYINRRVDSAEYASIESYSPAYLPAGGVLVEGGAVPYFATRFYSDRVEIYGRYNVWGDHGKNVIPIVNDCVSSLGGTSSERTAEK